MSNSSRQSNRAFSSNSNRTGHWQQPRLAASPYLSDNWRMVRASGQPDMHAEHAEHVEARRTSPPVQMQTNAVHSRPSEEATCYYFAKYGSCRLPDNKCQFVHYWTATVANPPIQSLDMNSPRAVEYHHHHSGSEKAGSSSHALMIGPIHNPTSHASNITGQSSNGEGSSVGSARQKSSSPPQGGRLPKHFSKPLTCHYWNKYGRCNKSDDDCGYAHWFTGIVSSAPIRIERGQPAIAGRNAELALEMRVHDHKTARPNSSKGRGMARQIQTPPNDYGRVYFETSAGSSEQACMADESGSSSRPETPRPSMMSYVPPRAETASPTVSVTESEMVKDQQFFQEYFNEIDRTDDSGESFICVPGDVPYVGPVANSPIHRSESAEPAYTGPAHVAPGNAELSHVGAIRTGTSHAAPEHIGNSHAEPSYAGTAHAGTTHARPGAVRPRGSRYAEPAGVAVGAHQSHAHGISDEWRAEDLIRIAKNIDKVSCVLDAQHKMVEYSIFKMIELRNNLMGHILATVRAASVLSGQVSPRLQLEAKALDDHMCDTVKRLHELDHIVGLVRSVKSDTDKLLSEAGLNHRLKGVEARGPRY